MLKVFTYLERSRNSKLATDSKLFLDTSFILCFMFVSNVVKKLGCAVRKLRRDSTLPSVCLVVLCLV